VLGHHERGVRRPLSIPERLRGKRANCTAMAVEQPDLELLSGLL
jgi:hypothetical protein